MLWKFRSIAICFNDRFWYYMSIQYWPNNRSVKVSIDTYCRPQKPSKSANRYLSQATIGLQLELDPIDRLLTRNLLSRVTGLLGDHKCSTNLNKQCQRCTGQKDVILVVVVFKLHHSFCPTTPAVHPVPVQCPSWFFIVERYKYYCGHRQRQKTTSKRISN